MRLALKLGLIIGIALGLQACGDISPEESCNFVRNADKQRVSWTSLPVKVFVHESVPSARYEDIQAAADHWNNVASRPLIQIVSTGVEGSAQPKRDNFNMVTWHTQWTGKMTEQGRTTINWAKSRVYEADIKINAQTFIYHDDGHGTPFVDLTSLMIHEFGHLLGLAHNEDHDSVMRSQLGFGVRRGYALDENNNIETDIKAVDVKSMSCEYSMLK